MKKTRWLDRRIAAPGPHLALVLSADEFAAAVQHLKVAGAGPWIGEGADATTHSFTHGNTGDHCCIVAIDADGERSGVEVAGLLVHEAVHVWQAHCRHIGESDPGHEHEAYCIQGIAQELMTEFARRRANTA